MRFKAIEACLGGASGQKTPGGHGGARRARGANWPDATSALRISHIVGTCAPEAT